VEEIALYGPMRDRTSATMPVELDKFALMADESEEMQSRVVLRPRDLIHAQRISIIPSDDEGHAPRTALSGQR
jgi:hypothetical protein